MSATCWRKARAGRLDFIFFPMIDMLTTMLDDCRGSNACPAGAATPEAVQSAFSLSRNLFEEHKITYLHPLINLADRELFALQMFECWKDILGLDWQENSRAMASAFAAQHALREPAPPRLPPAVWTRLERERADRSRPARPSLSSRSGPEPGNPGFAAAAWLSDLFADLPAARRQIC